MCRLVVTSSSTEEHLELRNYFAVVLVDSWPLRRIVEVQQQVQVATIIQLCIN